MKKKKQYEITSIGVRDDSVVNKGKKIFGVGAVIATIGIGIALSGRQWFTADEYYTRFGNTNDDNEDETE